MIFLKFFHVFSRVLIQIQGVGSKAPFLCSKTVCLFDWDGFLADMTRVLTHGYLILLGTMFCPALLYHNGKSVLMLGCTPLVRGNYLRFGLSFWVETKSIPPQAVK